MKTDTSKPNTIEEDFVVTPNEYLFSGGGEFEPITIKASSLAEATEKWEQTRVAVGTPEALSIEK